MGESAFYTDKQLASMLDPSGTIITFRSIRTEREKGRLVGTRIAGKWLFSADDVRDWLKSVRVVSICPDQISAPDSSPSVAPEPVGHSSSRAGRRRANDESTASVLADLKRRGNGSRRGSKSETRSGGPAQVIPLR